MIKNKFKVEGFYVKTVSHRRIEFRVFCLYKNLKFILLLPKEFDRRMDEIVFDSLSTTTGSFCV